MQVKAVAKARSYGELAASPWVPPSTGRLVERGLAEKSKGERDPQAIELALARRANNRAYAGAPPTIPHAISSLQASDCLGCHEFGIAFTSQMRASAISHAAFTSCTQCHASSHVEMPVDATLVADARARYGGGSFHGLAAAGEGARAWAGAPPATPHPTHLRENCLSCHGSRGNFALRSSHPERVACEQCHLSQATTESSIFKGPSSSLSNLKKSVLRSKRKQ